jgi:exodeoxyribonuclease-1
MTNFTFEDERLADMLFRYRARNFPASLSEVETAAWLSWCRAKWGTPDAGCLADRLQRIAALESGASTGDIAILQSLKQYLLETEATLPMA